MRSTAFRVFMVALLLVVAGSFGFQRAARASDAGAVIGGIVAGALVYEMLDDEPGCCGQVHYYHGPSYYHPPYRRPGYYGGTTVYYYDYYPPVTGWYYEVYPRTHAYRYDYYAPRYSERAYRAPSHAQRVGPPPAYHKPGGKYRPPSRYRK